MDKLKVVKSISKIVKEKFKGEATGHDWYHIERVWKLAKLIAKNEKGADTFIVELGALLHDIADWKFHNGDLTAGPKEAKRLLRELKVSEQDIAKVCHIVKMFPTKAPTWQKLWN